MAAGAMSISSGNSAARAAAASMGISRVVLAVLDVASVRNVTARHTHRISSSGGNSVNPARAEPSSSLSPDATKPRARQMPPANSSSTPHGIRLARSQSSSRAPLPSGVRHISTTASRATEASLACGRPSHRLQPPNGSLRVIQASAVIANRVSTRRSATRQGPTSGKRRPAAVPRPRVRVQAMTGTSTTTTGIPQLIQREKLTE